MKVKSIFNYLDIFRKASYYSSFLVFLLFSSCNKEEDFYTSGFPADTNQFKILILMYHDLTEGEPADIYVRRISNFNNDLNYIKSKNYRVISFDDLIKIKNGELKLSSDAIIISFDDGYLCNYTVAYPLLKKFKYPATFFIVTDWVDNPDRVSWTQVIEMDQYRATGRKKLFSIESHSKTHPFLVTDSGTFSNHIAYQSSLKREIGVSKNHIRNITGQESMWLALPYGDGANNAGIINTAKSYGYSGIRTSIWGSFTIENMNLFALPSLPVLSTTNITVIDNYLN